MPVYDDSEVRAMKKQIMILLGTALLAGCTGSGGSQAKMTGQEVHSRFMTMIAAGQYPEAYDFLHDRLTDEEILQKDYALIKGIMSAPVRVVSRQRYLSMIERTFSRCFRYWVMACSWIP